MNSLAEPTTIIIVVLCITIAFIIGFTISNKKQRDLEKQEFLEYKRMKELEAKEEEEKKETNKKTTSKEKSKKTK